MSTDTYVQKQGELRYPADSLYQSVITLVFFITYTLFQPVATIACRKIGPRIFLSTITLFWGACMIGFGFVENWEALVGLRLLLGILEVGPSWLSVSG